MNQQETDENLNMAHRTENNIFRYYFKITIYFVYGVIIHRQNSDI